MDPAITCPPTDDQLPRLAELRWEWLQEKGEVPTISRDEFVASFVDWARRNTSSHRPLVMQRGREIIGMAWLAVLPRVPTPHAVERASGDVQCVYVVPEERDEGHGSRLIGAVLRLARDLGLERVTVHSSERAISAYKRQGFGTAPRLLQADITTAVPHNPATNRR